MKVIANILVLEMKDKHLTKAEIHKLLKGYPKGFFHTMVTPADSDDPTIPAYKQLREVEHLLRPYCHYHITCISYKGKAKFTNLTPNDK